jgi:hypothetical protein
MVMGEVNGVARSRKQNLASGTVRVVGCTRPCRFGGFGLNQPAIDGIPAWCQLAAPQPGSAAVAFEKLPGVPPTVHQESTGTSIGIRRLGLHVPMPDEPPPATRSRCHWRPEGRSAMPYTLSTVSWLDENSATSV